jgi:hypothetical protein
MARAVRAPFSEWGALFPDLRLAAIVDRITFNAHIIETGTQSDRLATSKTRNGALRQARRSGTGA